MINTKGFTQPIFYLDPTSLQQLIDFAESLPEELYTAYITRQSAIRIGIPGAGMSEDISYYGFLNIYIGRGAKLIEMVPAQPHLPVYYLPKTGGVWASEWNLRNMGGGNKCLPLPVKGGGVNVQYKNVIGSPDKCIHTSEAVRISLQQGNDTIYKVGRTNSFISWSFGRNPFKRYVEPRCLHRSWGLYSFRRSHIAGWSQRSNYNEHIRFGTNYNCNRSITPLRKGVAA